MLIDSIAMFYTEVIKTKMYQYINLLQMYWTPDTISKSRGGTLASNQSNYVVNKCWGQQGIHPSVPLLPQLPHLLGRIDYQQQQVILQGALFGGLCVVRLYQYIKLQAYKHIAPTPSICKVTKPCDGQLSD